MSVDVESAASWLDSLIGWGLLVEELLIYASERDVPQHPTVKATTNIRKRHGDSTVARLTVYCGLYWRTSASRAIARTTSHV